MRYGLLVLVAAIVAVASIALTFKRERESGVNNAIGGSFSLTDQNGKTVTERDLEGKYALVYFGFTHCPDMCPMGLTTITTALQAMKEEGEKITPVLITVDPKRDTPKQLKAYAKSFHPRLVALTGSEEALKSVQDSYKVYAEEAAPKEPHASGHHGHGEYTVNHSGYMYLMDRKGRNIAHYSHDISPEKLEEDLRTQLRAHE